jgi:hypothetical protein
MENVHAAPNATKPQPSATYQLNAARASLCTPAGVPARHGGRTAKKAATAQRGSSQPGLRLTQQRNAGSLSAAAAINSAHVHATPRYGR